MFFRKKDFRYYLTKGEQLFDAQQYADARIALSDALDKLERGPEPDGSGDRARELFARAGNQLAMRNIDEASVAITMGNDGKAREHLLLALELADDVTLREKAYNLKETLASHSTGSGQGEHAHSCSGCASHQQSEPVTQDSTSDFLSSSERFELLVQTLPADLSSRYMGLGEKFASSCLLSSEGCSEEALAGYLDILRTDQSDIVLYEAAVQYHRLGKLEECESYLLRAYALNGSNPLVCVALVQAYCESNRCEEALTLLHTMLDKGVEPDNALLLMGDIYRDTDRHGAAIDCYAKALSGPSARVAAERMIPLLEHAGRAGDAKILFKRYVKGCC